jgi:hypothetical protein
MRAARARRRRTITRFLLAWSPIAVTFLIWWAALTLGSTVWSMLNPHPEPLRAAHLERS